MASASKFPSGLNNWVGTDRAKRQDFVDDNQIIDAFMQQNGGTQANAYALAPESWTQQESGEWNYTISGDGFFATQGYMYQITVAPGELLAVAALGGIYLYGIPANGSVVLMCPKQPVTAINATITRQGMKSDGEGGEG